MEDNAPPHEWTQESDASVAICVTALLEMCDRCGSRKQSAFSSDDGISWRQREIGSAACRRSVTGGNIQEADVRFKIVDGLSMNRYHSIAKSNQLIVFKIPVQGID